MTLEATEQVADWLRDSLGWAQAEFVSALAGGNSNLTWQFRDGERACVVRTPPADDISPTSARGIQREAQILQAIADYPVKAPGVLAWCDDETVIGRPFLVQEWVDGVALTDALPSAYAGSPDSVNRLGEDLIDQLAALHAVPTDLEALAKLGRPERFVERQIERWLGVRKEHAVRDLPELFSLGEWLQRNVPTASAPAVIHGDYHLDNTLASKEQPEILAIIDWELATVGDCYMDVALMLMFWGDYRTQEPPAFSNLQAVSRRAGVVSRRELAGRWAESLGRPLNHMNFYMALAFWRLAAIIEGAYGLHVAGKLDSDYARGLEYDVPALLAEAQAAAAGDW
jgi:aminoglycoside phosphotransferase (APT) family kinase protein